MIVGEQRATQITSAGPLWPNKQSAAGGRPAPPVAYWADGIDELTTALGSRVGGLNTSEAAERLILYGENIVANDTEVGILRLAWRQVESPLVLILVFGALISMVLRQWTDALIILFIVIGSAALGFFQEFRASKAMALLRRRLSITATVIRDGRSVAVPVNMIVPGDVVQLSAGNLVPADGCIIEARDFLVSEAPLTGESFPTEKRRGAVPSDAPISQRTNAVFLGTSVRSGTATMLAVVTGPQTELGLISGRIATAQTDSEFFRGLRQFGYLLTRVMTGVVLFVLVINLLGNRPVIDSLLFAVAIAVGLSPELLPAIVSVTLSAGARRLAARGVLVRRLEAIENLGSIDILCTDKTGTLTMGNVALEHACDPQGTNSSEVLRLAFINADLETGIANPLDVALVAAGRRGGLDTGGECKLDEIPYDFIRRRLTIVIGDATWATTATMITKGAVAEVVAGCSHVDRNGASLPIDQAVREAIEQFCRAHAANGYRVLALATRALPRRDRYSQDDERGMVLRGFLLFVDPVKEGIDETLSDLRRAGIRTIIVTGDNRHVAAHIGEMVGIACARVLTGQDLNKTKDEALWHLAEEVNVFAEVDPQQKERLVRALQQRGHAVAFLGDGINDAPALLAADVGISVDSAVDVARESADVVLLVRDLEVLKDGIVEGRRTFANTLKYIRITVSANFGNMISMAIATLWLPFLPMTAKQILLNNFLSDFPSLAIAGDNLESEMLQSPQRWSMDEVRRFMIGFGLISTAFDLLTFAVLLWVFRADAAHFQTAWFVVSLLTEIAALLVLRTQRPIIGSRPGRLLLTSSMTIVVVALIAPYLGGLANAFGFVPLPLPILLCLGVVVLAYAGTIELAKYRIGVTSSNAP